MTKNLIDIGKNTAWFSGVQVKPTLWIYDLTLHWTAAEVSIYINMIKTFTK